MDIDFVIGYLTGLIIGSTALRNLIDSLKRKDDGI